MNNTLKNKVGRPKGSKTKQSGNSISVMKFEKQIDNTPVTKDSQFGWRKWGKNNDYPALLLNLYSQSPTHHAAVDFAVASILGNGVDFEQMQLNGDEVVPNSQQTWDEVIKAIATDYIIYGSYAIQILLNKDIKTFSFYPIPLDKVRWGEFDEDGNIPYFYICSDWTEMSLNPPIRVDSLETNLEGIQYGVPYLYVYKTYNPTLTYYTMPKYSAAIQAIQSEIEFINHDLKSAVNNFIPSGMLVLNSVETDDERNAVIKNIQNMFVGTSNSNSLMVTFRNNVEEQAPSFVPFAANTGNVNIYEDANKRAMNRILCAHQIPNAALIGCPDLNQNGFSSEADKLEVSYQLYNKLTGNSNRMAVIRTLNQMLKMNGIETEIVMKPLNFNDFGDDADVEERTGAEPINEVDKNNEEKQAEQ